MLNKPITTTLWEPHSAQLTQLLTHYGLCISSVEPEEKIPGSHWGDEEAGLIANRIYLRADTPLHSALHEACHYICMDQNRRKSLHTDAGGCDTEENAVCYLQILLADFFNGYDRHKMMDEMDRWGYSFRLGSAKTWFDQDAEDALAFLQHHNLMGHQNMVCLGALRRQ